MNIKFEQPAGIGDILFCLKIAKELINQGHVIYWPVISQYLWIKDYIIVDNLFWEDIKDPDGTLDLQSAGKTFPQMSFMDAKYALVEMDFNDWQKYASFKRNEEKEEILYSMMVKENPYCLICDTYASPPSMVVRTDIYSKDLFEVRTKIIGTFTPFDWCKIIEDAEELRLVDTCFTHIVELLSVKAKKRILYSRDGNFYTKSLWKKSWEYVT